MGFQDREYVRNRGRESRRLSQLNEASPWRREASGFNPWLLIGLLAVFGAGFACGMFYADSSWLSLLRESIQ